MPARTVIAEDFAAATCQSANVHTAQDSTPVTVTLHPEFRTRVAELLLSEGRAMHLDETGINRETSVNGAVETIRYTFTGLTRTLKVTLTRPVPAAQRTTRAEAARLRGD